MCLGGICNVCSTIKSPALDAGPYLKLSVNDTGHGMDKAVKDRILNPFVTTKKVEEGTGLGLSVVHGIVMNHCNAIIADSDPGKGTVFHIFIPIIVFNIYS